MRFVKNSPLKNPFIRTKDTRRTFELYNDFLLLDENGRIKFLVLNVKYKEEVKLVSEFFEYYDDELIGLSFKRNREFHVVLDFSEFKKLKFLSIKNMKVENIIFPYKSELISVELFLTDINSISNLGELNELELFKATNLLFDNLDELSNSKKLKNLVLIHQNNRISKLPNLNNFKDLEYLSFNSKYVKKILGIESLLKLKSLFVGLYFNFENIKFPNSIEIMHLSGVENFKMPNLKGNVNLKKLSISGTSIKKIEGLDDLVNLEELNFLRNKVEEISDLEKLKKLKKLNLSGNNIENIENIEELNSLEELDLSYNMIKSTKGMNKNLNLKRVDLEQNKIKKVEDVNNLTNMIVLNLVFNPIEEFDYSSVNNLTNTKIRLSDTPVGDAMTKAEKKKYRKLNKMLFF